jgi:hypothetical protein
VAASLCATREESGLPTWLDWATFARDLTARHTSATHYDNVRDQFAAIHQTGSVTAYIAGFNQLVLQIPDLGTAERRSTFMRGLKPHIKIQVYLHCREGEDLEAVMALAEKVDDITYNPVPHRSHPLTPAMRPPFPASQDPEPMRPPFPASQDPEPMRPPFPATQDPQSMRPLSLATQGPVPMELGAMQHAFYPDAAPTNRLAAVSVPRAPLTEQQRAALFENDGCFYCRRPHAGHFSSECPARRNWPSNPNTRSATAPGRRQGNGPPRR